MRSSMIVILHSRHFVFPRKTQSFKNAFLKL